MIDNIIIAAISASVIIALSIYILFLKKVLKRVGVELKQAILDKAIAIDTLRDVSMQKEENVIVEKTEGFLKFISQSRDWAFQYIEEVQSELNKFVETVGPIMEYYDKYGRIHENTSMNKVFDAYSELIKILPEDEKTNKEK